MCPIDDIMDLNGDGKATDFEKILLAGALAETMEAEEKAQEANDRLADLIARVSGVPGVTVEIVTGSLDDLSKNELLERLEELQEEFDDLECEEPEDMSSEEYDTWEERIEELEEQIDEIESMIEDMNKGER